MSFDFYCDNELSNQAKQYVAREYACQITNSYQVEALKKLKEKHPGYSIDLHNMLYILKVDNEHSARAYDYLSQLDAWKITNPYQVEAAKKLKEKNPRYSIEEYNVVYILKVDNEHSARAYDYLSPLDAWKITNQYQVEAAKKLKEKNPGYSIDPYNIVHILKFDRQCKVDLIQAIGLYQASQRECQDKSNHPSDL